MSKYKVCVYAISKNEEKFVDRWYQSVKEADKIIVVDTGSTDDTVKKLRNNGVEVYEEIISPWRFDTARNKSLELVPDDFDICVCIDLDEVFVKGWREELEKVWNENITRVRYNYNWNLDENNVPRVSFLLDKIHSRKNYIWTHPVHEVLTYNGITPETFTYAENITVNHYPDSSKSRGSYLNLLELSIKEDPEDDRNMHYLGREYMYYGRWNDAIDTLIKHLSLKRATWKDERCASMRFIARCYKNLKRYDEANMWLDKAIREAPYSRDPYVEMAILKYELNDWSEVIIYCEKALQIKKQEKTYINEIFSWNETIYDLLSIAYFNVGNIEKALENAKEALKINDNDRIRNNVKLINDALNKKIANN